MWQIKFACHKTPICVFKTFPQTKNIKMKNIYIYVVRVQRKAGCYLILLKWPHNMIEKFPRCKNNFSVPVLQMSCKIWPVQLLVRTFLIKHWLVIKLTIQENRTAFFLVLQNIGNMINVFCFFCFVWHVCSRSVQHG